MQFPERRYLIKSLVIALVLGGLAVLIHPVGSALGLMVTVALAGFLTALIAGTRYDRATGPNRTVFVGNLAFKATEEEVRQLFDRYGPVREVRVMRHPKTNRPRGFAFVEMPERAARRAIGGLDGADFHGRKLRVSEGKGKNGGESDQTQ